VKLRDSGMPEEEYWESLLDTGTILDRLEVGPHLSDVLEIGCGYGTFTIPVAQRISGALTALDIEPDMVERTRERAAHAGLENVVTLTRDAHADGFVVPAQSQDACLLFNLLHCEDPQRLLMEAARTVRAAGAVLVIHWRHDPDTPRGPAMSIRPTPGQIVAWAEATGLLRATSEVIDLPPWHYGLIFSMLNTTTSHGPDERHG